MIIYKITNLVNGKVYIGQTVQKNPKARWYDHCAKARRGINQPLFNAINKYGVDKFSWEVIDSADSLEALNDLEEQYVEKYNSINEGYNIRDAGGNKLHNELSIEKMQAAQTAAHARRRAEGRDGGWTRIDGGSMLGKKHPAKGTKRPGVMTAEVKENLRQIKLAATYCRGKSWKIINGKRVWLAKEI
jgi:group I intron endonuclease